MINRLKNIFKDILYLFSLILFSLILSKMNDYDSLSKTIIQGEKIAGGIIFFKSEEGVKAFLDGNAIPVSQNGSFIIGFHRDPKVKQILKIIGKNMQEEIILYVKKRNYNIQRIDGIDPSKVNPPVEVIERIRKEAKLVKNARFLSRSIATPYYEEGFQVPAEGVISGVYGSQRILNGEPRQPHYGIDIALPIGHPVTAAGTGKVLLAERDLYFSGGTIIIGHGQGLTTTYLHLSKIKVNLGEYVDKGSLIGEVGSTGRVTGPHLDWRAEWMGRRIDPAYLVNF